jgi:CRISPR-associated protein Cas1
MFEPLYALRWQRLRVQLRCQRNVFARELPLAIFEGVFKSAARRQCPPPDQPFFFHPQQPTGERIRAGRTYGLDVIFPTSPAAMVAEFGQRLAAHLAEVKNNFELVSASAPESRSLAQLEQETAALADAVDEACLEFITPLAFRPPEPQRRWLLDAPGLMASLARRVERLFGLKLDWPDEAAAGLRTLPCYWHYTEGRHQSKSGTGFEFLNGCVGPLYLQGPVAPWLPLLRLGSELHAAATDGRGQRLAFGAGAYQLHACRPFFNANLLNPSCWAEVCEELAAERPEPDPFLHALDGPDALQALVEDVRQGRWQPEPAHGFRVDKPAKTVPPGTAAPAVAEAPPARLIAELPTRDRVLHGVLHRLLSPPLDRLFEGVSWGFRPGRSTADAARAVLEHVRAGCLWVVETDIASFFDTVDWELLEQALDRCLPRADTLLRELLRRVVRTPLLLDNARVARTHGLLQGSPLSPLLANVFLDAFDEAAVRAGLRLVRYADDFLLLCRDEAEAQQALQTARELLAPLRLELQPAKTALTPVGAGFSFLGHRFAAEMTEDFLERTTLRKPVHVLPDYSFLGLEGDALIVRRDEQLVARLPLRRASELFIYGAHAVSTPLLQHCARQGLPVALCTAAGHHYATLGPDSRRYYELAGRHWQRHAALPESERLALAREVVAAKLSSYLAWARELTGERRFADTLDRSLATLESATDVPSLLGREGETARRSFRWVNERVRETDFRSALRLPREKPDRWNVLLDFAYTRLFARLNVLLNARGLNPYLGFLHSPANNYESLTCDLQEPFRARCDRWALRLVNLRQVRPEDFEPDTRGGLRLTRDATRRLLQAWEQEMDTRWGGDAGTLEQLLHAQVEAVREWVFTKGGLRLYRPHSRQGPPRPEPPPARAVVELVEQAFACATEPPAGTQPGPAEPSATRSPTQEHPPIPETSSKITPAKPKSGEFSENTPFDI